MASFGSAGVDEQNACSAEMLQVLSAISSGAVTPDVLAQVNQLIKELVEIKLRYLNHDPSLTVEQLSRIKNCGSLQFRCMGWLCG